MDAAAQTLLFIHSWTPALGTVLAILRMGLPSSIYSGKFLTYKPPNLYLW